MQLLSVTDKTSAAADFATVRKNLLASMPGELAPIDIVKIFNLTEAAKNPGPSGKGNSTSTGGGTGQGNSGTGQGNSGTGQGNSGNNGNGASSGLVGSSFMLSVFFSIAMLI